MDRLKGERVGGREKRDKEREIVQSVERFPGKHEDLRLMPWNTYTKQLAVNVHCVISEMRKGRQKDNGGPQASQSGESVSSRFSEQLCLNSKVESD